ncbi:MAG TPA: hypothetical protein VFA48_09015 [Gammaproteobacteria bacterium]|nr:hypothetical protein [Gammaproteobacteria bacterium]
MKKLRKATFDPLLNQTFAVRPDDNRTIPVKLASITQRDLNAQFENFTLNFDPLDDASALPDGNYLLENEQLGQAMIFISATPAIGPEPGRFYYEAVFNVYIGDDGNRGQITV